KIMSDLNNTADPAERTKLLQAAQKQLADDYVVGFLFEYPNIVVANKDVQGVWENAPIPAVDLTGVSWAE
ncbi:MAG: ABC transporter substrate-binding protein, partial [Devosia sp.]